MGFEACLFLRGVRATPWGLLGGLFEAKDSEFNLVYLTSATEKQN